MVSLTQVRPFICFFLAGALLVSQLAACTSWCVQNIAARQFTATDFVRIVRLDGTQVTLTGARLSGDTLYGNPNAYTLLAIPLNDVRMFEVRHEDVVKTLGLGLGIAALLAGSFLAILAIAISSEE